MTTSPWRVSVRTDPSDVVRLVERDEADLARSPFQRPQWLETWIATFATGTTRKILAAVIENAETGEPVFVLPLTIERRGGVTRLKAWDLGVSDYNAPVLAKSFHPTPADMNMLWTQLLRLLPRVDLLELEKLPSGVGKFDNPLIGVNGIHESAFFRHPLALQNDFEGLANARFNPTNRRSMGRKRRKLMNKGRLEFEMLDGAVAWPVLERLLDWRRARFHSESCLAELERTDAFYRSLCHGSEIARVGRLTLDGRLLAGCFGTLTDDTFQLLVVGHDAEFKNWSPGLLVIESSIEWMCRRGVAVYDFTIGGERYKFDFGVEAEVLYELRTPLSIKGGAYLHLQKAYRHVRGVLRGRRGGTTDTPAADDERAD